MSDDPRTWLHTVEVVPLRNHSGSVVDAAFGVINSVGYVRKAAREWTHWTSSNNKPAPLFNWVSVYNFNADALAFALDFAGEAQAFMLLRSQHVVRCDAGHRASLVYVGFLEVAPWNGTNATTRRFRGIGPVMIRLACDLSEQRDFGGRLGLHSVSTAEAFYLRLGFRAHDCPNEYNELYMELDESAAEVMLQE